MLLPYSCAARLRSGRLLLALLLAPAAPALAQTGFAPGTPYPCGSNLPAKVVLGDVNGDGLADIVAGNQSGAAISVLLNQPAAAGTFGTPLRCPTGGGQPRGIALGDVNGDGRPDIVTANAAGGNVSVLLSLAPQSATFAPPTSYGSGGTQPTTVALGDVNGDGRPDIVTGDFVTGRVGVLLNQAGLPGTFGAVATFDGGVSRLTGVALGDVNGDGRPDIVTGSFGGGGIGVLLSTAPQAAQFSAPTTYVASGPADVVLHDVNGDGRLDILAADSYTDAVLVLLNQASLPGAFGAATSYSSGGRYPGYLAVRDVSGDGRADIVVGNEGAAPDPGSVGVLLGLPGQPGTFGAVVTYSSGDLGPFSIALGDVNGDGRPDAVTSNYRSTTVSVLLNSFPTAAATAAATVVDIYPNPAQAQFTVRLPAGFGPAQAELLNSLGQVVRQQALPAQVAVPTTGLPAGVYTLRLRPATGPALTRRVVLH
ncbi:T9SS type A sorting domain-containing protein [Hymenobacter sp. ASUV-10]|uniref:T9SS type A sorting domain-containing protein n=1 Tax=Hymenobacter aranciens TaxID=3063996 RepID=A0ABT9BAA0_9BACT|nr:T9SS type A sorting domain-containing protein [Hymenobacter sp. ASUV-10]MDO7875197.1 T9SS type A sorting domain-containing protein [Hymenobacter sp. ASUV-10]